MQIDEQRVYVFKFPYQNSDFTIPVKAETKQEAVDILQKWLSGVQTDLAIEFPKITPNTTLDTDGKPVNIGNPPMFVGSSIPPEVLELRLDTLLADMGGGQLKGKAKDETIKLWTGYDLIPENYTHIITELELLKTGVKEIPTKQNGKK